jgi:HSP20 family protein
LLLEAKTGERFYRKETLIEDKLAAGAPHLNLRNGVLEVRLSKIT